MVSMLNGLDAQKYHDMMSESCRHSPPEEGRKKERNGCPCSFLFFILEAPHYDPGVCFLGCCTFLLLLRDKCLGSRLSLSALPMPHLNTWPPLPGYVRKRPQGVRRRRPQQTSRQRKMKGSWLSRKRGASAISQSSPPASMGLLSSGR